MVSRSVANVPLGCWQQRLAGSALGESQPGTYLQAEWRRPGMHVPVSGGPLETLLQGAGDTGDSVSCLQAGRVTLEVCRVYEGRAVARWALG